MSLNLTLAGPDHFPQVQKLYIQFREETGQDHGQSDWVAGVQAVLEGSVMGSIYLIGPVASPVGFVLFSFGFDIELNSLRAQVDAIYIRPTLRRRGMAIAALWELCGVFRGHGVRMMTCTTPLALAPFGIGLQKIGFRSGQDAFLVKSLDQ